MILWLASYPKSGNTWIRLLITHYFSHSEDLFENINKIDSFPNKKQFYQIIDENSLKKEPLKLFEYFIEAQKKINTNKKLNILKTHNFGGSIRGNEFTNKDNTCGLIYIVRDPRSVAVSYAYHANVSFEDSVDLILNENRLTYDKTKMYPEARLSWNVNLVSWLNTPYPKLLIKYEQLKLNTFKEFKSILLFLNKFTKFEIDDQKIDKVIKDCSFENLTNLEKKIGFKEKFGKVNFFRKGESDEWKKELSADLVKKIEKKFSSEMKDLGYL